MEKIADKVTNYFIYQGIIKQEDYSIYHYGFQIGLEFVCCISISAIVAYLLDILLEFLIAACVLLALRAYLCGIHMKKFFSCLICSVVLMTCGPLLAKHIILSKWIMLIISITVMALMHKLAYITTKSSCDLKEVEFYARRRRDILMSVLIILVIAFFLDKLWVMQQLLYSISVAFFTVVMQLFVIES